MNCFPGRDPVLLGDPNAGISRLRNNWYQLVAYFVASFGMVDLLDHFRNRLFYHNLYMWLQVHQGQILLPRCEYILGSDKMMFKTIGISDPQNFASKHFSFRARLLQ